MAYDNAFERGNHGAHFCDLGKLEAALAQRDALAAALKGMVDMYADLVNSGDAGFWDPEKVDEVKQARVALALMHVDVGGSSK